MDSDDRAVLEGIQHQLDQLKAQIKRIERALGTSPAKVG